MKALLFSIFAFSVVATEFEGKSVQEFLRETVVEGKIGNISLSETVFKAWYEQVNTPKPKFAPGMVSQACLQCICEVESGCKPIGCKMDVGSLSCGYFQIKEPYWIDCGRPGNSLKECGDDIMCSSQCVQKYMARYAKRHGCPLNCEGFAREHNGGPDGCNNPNTLKYWQKIQKLPGCQHVQK